MPAIAQRRADLNRQQTTSDVTRKVRRSRPRRRVRGAFPPALRLGLVGLCVLVLLGWMSVYARLAVAGYARSDLLAACKQEQLKNQELRIRLDTLRRPQNVVAEAQKSGMVYATEYEYVGGPRDVASTGNGAGD